MELCELSVVIPLQQYVCRRHLLYSLRTCSSKERFFFFQATFNMHFSLKSTAAAALVKQYISGSTYFLLKQAVEGEDKHALESVEDSEEVC